MTEGTEFARELRQRHTLAEARLWKALRGSRLDSLKFRRQHRIGRYFADFACESAFLVIELDGAIHDQDDNPLNDQIRQQAIESLGWFVMRFRNEQVIGSLHTVLDAIREQVRLGQQRNPSPSHSTSLSGPLPLPLGEG